MPTPQEIIEAWKKQHKIELTPEQDKALLADIGKVPTQEDWGRFLSKEREVTQLESSFKTREKTLAEREAEVKKYLESMDALKQDPITWAEKQGLNYEEWTKRIVADGKPDPVMQLQRELEEVKAQNQKLQEAVEGNQQNFSDRQAQEGVAQELTRFDGIISDKKFDVIRTYAKAYERFSGQPINLHDVVKSMAVQHFNKHKDEIESGRMQELTLNEIADNMLSEAQARWEAIPEPAKQSLIADPAKQTGKETQQQQQQADDTQHFAAFDGHQADQGEGTSQQALTAGDETASPPADFEKMDADERLEHVKTHGLPAKYK